MAFSHTDFSTSTKILRRREDILFRKQVKSSNVPISYFSSDKLYSTTTLYIADRSGSLVENRVLGDNDPIVKEDIISYDIATDQFVMTDVFTDDNGGTVASIPLFFKHIISTANLPRVSSSNLTIADGSKLISLDILDSNLTPLSSNNIKIDYTEGIIYNDYESSFDILTGESKVYYVRYTIRTSSQILTYIDLLDNQDIFSVATFDDLDDTLTIIPTHKVYLIESSGDLFTLTLPKISTYAFRIISSPKLQILPPPPLDSTSPWRVSITNGNFYAIANGTTQKYQIAEFASQAWNPYSPYKLSEAENSSFVSETLIKTNRNNILESSDLEVFIDLLINDEDGNGVSAFTTDPSDEGTTASNGKTYKKWNKINRIGIKSVDHRSGFLEVEGLTLLSTYELIATYTYKETNYEFTIMDFNPVNNQDMLTQRVSLVVDTNPDNSKTTTLYYLISNKSGKVIQSNLPDWDPDTNLYLGMELYYESVPSFIDSSDKLVFVQGYSTEGQGSFFILGDIYVNENSSPASATNIDVRLRGGGLLESNLTALKAKNIESSMYWDLGFWDGTPYPANSCFYVEVPVSILDGGGGIFKQSEIKDIISRHVSGGTYPIVKAYGIDPKITSVTPNQTSIDLEWGSYGSDVRYSIYYSTSLDGPWTLSNASLIHDGNPNSYRITGLVLGVVYYVLVVAGKLDSLNNFVPLMSQPIGPTESALIFGKSPNIIATKTFKPRTS